MSEFKPIKLPYGYGDVEPFVGGETMYTHYNKHYKGYIDKLNDLLKDRVNKPNDIEKLIGSIKDYTDDVRNNAGGFYNHTLFWSFLSPKRQTLGGNLKEKIERQFGSVEEFKDKFTEKCMSRFGSGWCWLMVSSRGRLKIVTTPNQDNPKMNIYPSKNYLSDKSLYVPIDGEIILGLDVWEHAYYLDYKNERKKYVDNFWKVVNWSECENKLNTFV